MKNCGIKWPDIESGLRELQSVTFRPSFPVYTRESSGFRINTCRKFRFYYHDTDWHRQAGSEADRRIFYNVNLTSHEFCAVSGETH